MSENSRNIPDPIPMSAIIGGQQYITHSATRIAYHWRPGRALRYYSTARRIHLFLTSRGNYFCQEQETEPESNDAGAFGWTRLVPLSPAEALRLYLDAYHKLMERERAFPGIDIEA